MSGTNRFAVGKNNFVELNTILMVNGVNLLKVKLLSNESRVQFNGRITVTFQVRQKVYMFFIIRYVFCVCANAMPLFKIHRKKCLINELVHKLFVFLCVFMNSYHHFLDTVTFCTVNYELYYVKHSLLSVCCGHLIKSFDHKICI